MTDGLKDTVKLTVTVEIEPEGSMTREQSVEVARRVVQDALNYALPRARFRPPFTDASLGVAAVEIPPP
jgi:hypothetical protein